MLTCCLVGWPGLGLELDLVFGWFLVMHTYLSYVSLSLLLCPFVGLV